MCVCGAALDGPRGGDRRSQHRRCTFSPIVDALAPAVRRSPRRRWLATPKDDGAPSTAIAGADRRSIDDKGRQWRKARRAALAALATCAPTAHRELTQWSGAASHVPAAREALRGELAAMPAPLAFLIRLEASAFDRARWKNDDGDTLRAKRDPAGFLASATVSRVWETATLGKAPRSLLAVVRNAARWLARGERRTGGAIGGKIDGMKPDERKEQSRCAVGRIIDALPAQQRALLAERLADCPSLLDVAERIADIQARAVGRDFTNAELCATTRLRETLARGLALAE